MPDLFKTLVWDTIVKAGLSLLFAAIPGLGFGPIGLVVSWVVSRFADELYSVGKEYFDFESIVFKNVEFRRAFDSASLKLKILAREKGIASKEFNDARDAHKTALSKFVRIAV